MNRSAASRLHGVSGILWACISWWGLLAWYSEHTWHLVTASLISLLIASLALLIHAYAYSPRWLGCRREITSGLRARGMMMQLLLKSMQFNSAEIHHEVVRFLLWVRLLTGSLLQTVGIWYVLYLKVVLSTVTFTYGNVLTELRAGKNNGWALFFNLYMMLLDLWERPGSKGNRLTLLQLGGSKAFFTGVTFYGYFFHVIVLQDKMYFLILSEHCSWFVVPTNLVSLVVSCCCKMRVHAATLDVSDLSDRGIFKNDFFPFQKTVQLWYWRFLAWGGKYPVLSSLDKIRCSCSEWVMLGGKTIRRWSERGHFPVAIWLALIIETSPHKDCKTLCPHCEKWTHNLQKIAPFFHQLNDKANEALFFTLLWSILSVSSATSPTQHPFIVYVRRITKYQNKNGFDNWGTTMQVWKKRSSSVT